MILRCAACGRSSIVLTVETQTIGQRRCVWCDVIQVVKPMPKKSPR